MQKEILEEILMKEDVVGSINENFKILLSIIPELEHMVGFEHKHPHHHLDVWNHTLLALSRAPFDFEIRLVLLLHDIGKPHSFQEGEVRRFNNHPNVSSNIALEILTRLGFSEEKIEEICYLIRRHDSLITGNDINNNINLMCKMFQIQFCDALAHHPSKLEKRINYLLNINGKINKGKEKEKYECELFELLKKSNNIR